MPRSLEFPQYQISRVLSCHDRSRSLMPRSLEFSDVTVARVISIPRSLEFLYATIASSLNTTFTRVLSIPLSLGFLSQYHDRSSYHNDTTLPRIIVIPRSLEFSQYHAQLSSLNTTIARVLSIQRSLVELARVISILRARGDVELHVPKFDCTVLVLSKLNK